MAGPGPSPSYRVDQRELFDRKIADEPASYTDPRWLASVRFEVKELSRFVEPRTVLNLGSGSGAHDVELAGLPSVERVLAVDYSSKSVDFAEVNNPHPKVERRVSDLLEVEEDMFDLAVSFQVIEHLPDPVGFLVECRRHVRPGGTVAVFTPNRERLPNRIRRLMGRPDALMDPQHAAEYTVEDIIAFGEGVGLRAVGSFSYGIILGLGRGRREVRLAGLARSLPPFLAPVANRFCVVLKRPG